MIYEINVPMFRDSNADGIGDLQGRQNESCCSRQSLAVGCFFRSDRKIELSPEELHQDHSSSIIDFQRL